MTEQDKQRVVITPAMIQVLHKDMEPEQLNKILEFISECFNRNELELECAKDIKEKLDTEFGSRWHCVVGRHFASHVTFADKKYLFVKVGKETCLVFQSGNLEGTPVTKV